MTPARRRPGESADQHAKRALEASMHALRSYQYGNAAPGLARQVADECEDALKHLAESPPASGLQIEFRQNDWIPGFASFLPSVTTPQGSAFCVLNVGTFLAVVESGGIAKADLPYLVAESMMHEVIHALEQWASVEFSEERVEALLAKYRSTYRKEGGAG